MDLQDTGRSNWLIFSPDWCSRKVPVGQEAGKLLQARLVETLQNQDLGQWTRPDN